MGVTAFAAFDDLPLAEWPNCSVPDCEYKVCFGVSDEKCFAHALGYQPPPYEQYMRGEGAAGPCGARSGCHPKVRRQG